MAGVEKAGVFDGTVFGRVVVHLEEEVQTWHYAISRHVNNMPLWAIQTLFVH
jgi:hypothetical protein